MKKVDIKTIYTSPKEFDGQEITVAGWVRSARGNGSFGFLTSMTEPA